MKTKKYFVKSNYERIADDNYQTIDKRCVQGLVDTWNIGSRVVDCCAPNGSGILDTMSELGFMTFGMDDAFGKVPSYTNWIITNPPYEKSKVDNILNYQIERVQKGEVQGFASLLRATFDFAKKRKEMFQLNPYFHGRTNLCFRPIWVEPIPGEKRVEPIHSYSWFIWKNEPTKLKQLKYWYEK